PPLNLPPAPPGAVRHRPLLDLFPPVPTAGEQRPAPFLRPTSRQQPAAVAVDLSSAPATPTLAVPATRPYEAFYGLREHPFGPSTDPRFYFPSAEHERVAGALVAAVHARQAATLLTGEPGMGKTTLCRAVVRRLDRRTVSSLVLERVASADDLLKQMLVDFGVVARHELAAAGAIPHESLVATLRSFVDSLTPLRAVAVVVLDDAHNQPTEVLDLLGRLIDRAGEAPAALQAVLVGLPSIAARLGDEPRLRALSAATATR